MGEDTRWQGGFLGVPGAVSIGVPRRPSVCCCWPLLLPSRSEVFCFPLSSIRTLALSTQREPRCFPCCTESLLIWGMARRPGSAGWKGGSGSGWCWPGSLYRAQVALRPSTAFPGTGLCTQCLGLLFGSLGSPCWPCSSQFTLAVLSSACHLGTNRLHSLPQSLVSAAVLAHGPPACVQCFSLHVCAGVCVCAQVCVCVRVRVEHCLVSYVFTDLCFATFFFPPLPSQFFFLPDPEFLCQLTARFFCFLLLLETNKT